jgi:hypothetical protein
LEYTNIIAFWEQILKSNVETTMATESSIFWSVEVKEEFVTRRGWYLISRKECKELENRKREVLSKC